MMKNESGFTIVEFLAAVGIIAIMSVIYSLMVGDYKDHRMSETAAKVLRQAAAAEEEYFAKHHEYFDADVTGNGDDVYLITPKGERTDVKAPAGVVLSLKARGKNKASFVGESFCAGSGALHRYDSREGKITSMERIRED
jgi:prepilin-type N-terminal cleavage/methylation domain-containing protein